MDLTELLARGRKLRLHDRAAAIECFERCMQEAEGMENWHVAAVAAMECALALVATRYPAALAQADVLLGKAARWLEAETANFFAGYLPYVRGMAAMAARDYATCAQQLQAAHRVLVSVGEDPSLVDDGLGQYFAMTHNIPKALEHFERSLARRQEMHDRLGTGASYVHLGRVYLQIERFDRAEEMFLQALGLADEVEDKYMRLQTLGGLADVAIGRSQWSIAKVSLEEALSLASEPVDTALAVQLHLSMAAALLGDGQGDIAQTYLETEVFPRCEQLQDERAMVLAKRLEGRILLQRLRDGRDPLTLDTLEATADFLSEVLSLCEVGDMPFEYASTLYDTACLYDLYAAMNYSYEYRGKQLRSLEMAQTVLEQFEIGPQVAIANIEAMLEACMGSRLS